MDDCFCREKEHQVFGAMIAVLNVKPGSLVRLTLPEKDSRWGIGRIAKLAAAIRKAGGELVVLKYGTTLKFIKGAS